MDKIEITKSELDDIITRAVEKTKEEVLTTLEKKLLERHRVIENGKSVIKKMV